MSGSITFVGAGPGAADLITVRGKRKLEEADVVIYAGSLVDERLLDGLHAEKHNSAGMNFEEVMEIMIRAWENGKSVVRLHTGDPAMYGAVGEQYRALDERGVPYEVVPGVSSVFAAAAALKTARRNISLSTACEQEKVNNIPPGRICSIAFALSR